MQKESKQTLIAVLIFLFVRFGDAVSYAIAAYLVGPKFHINPFQISFCYSAIGFLFMLPWACRQTKKQLSTKRIKPYMLRAILEFSAFSLAFYSLQSLELPKQVALGFATPLFAIILAMTVLKEKSYIHTWLALAIGFAGMLIITRPGVIPFSPGVVYALASALGFAGCVVIIKQLTATESPNKVAFYMLGMTTVLSLPFAAAHWVMPHGASLLWLVVVGIIGWSQQVLVADSISRVPLIVLMPLNFSRLVFAAVLAFFLFHQVIDRYTLAGAVLVVAATIYDGWASTVKAKKIKAENKNR